MKNRKPGTEWRGLARRLVLAGGLAATAALFASDSVTRDDLEGLRPAAGQNDFWDTSAHASYAVQVERGASSGEISSGGGATSLASAIADIARKFVFLFIVR